MAAREIREIVVRVDTPGEQGLKKLSDGFGKMNKNISEGASVLKRFEQAYFRIAGLSFAGIGLTAIIDSLDSFQKLNDRLKQTEGSSAGAAIALARLQQVAQSTNSSVTDTSQVYTRMSQSLADLNLGSEAVLGVTQTLQNAFRAYGATAAEARSATIQLGQGMASGQLRGQELRSVMEASGLMAEILAEKLKIPRGELLKWSEANGGIKNPVILGALADSFDRINEIAGKLSPTVGESLTMAFDKVKIAAGKFNEELGATKALGKAIMWVGDNIGTIASVLAPTIGLWVAYKAAVIAASAAQTIHTGLQVAFNLTMLLGSLGVKAYIVGLYELAAASSAAQLALGPVGIALGLITAGYVAWKMGADGVAQSQEKINERATTGKEIVNKNGDAMFRAANAQNKYLEAQKKSSEANSDMTMTGVKWREQQEKNLSSTDRLRIALQKAAKESLNVASETFDYKAALTALNKEFGEGGNIKEYKKRLLELEIGKLRLELKTGVIDLVRFNEEKAKLINGKGTTALKEYRDDVAELNKTFNATQDIAGYNKALQGIKIDKVARDAKDGRVSFLELNKAMRDGKLADYSRALNDGSMSFDQYRKSSQAVQLAQLNEEWRSGTISVYDYNKAVAATQDKFQPGSALFTGTKSFLDSMGTVNTDVSNMISNTFGQLENTMLEFIKNGKFSFKEFTQSILDDLTKIILRAMILRPLANGIIGGLSGGPSPDAAGGTTSYSTDYLAQAKGGAWRNGVQMYAKGGVVDSPTMFGHKRGLGVMGEKGSEAIMPLKRTASGDLGVQATPSTPVIVNITNNSGGEVEQKESTGPNGERVLDIMILGKVKEAFSNGSMDRTLNTQYGIRRKGI